VMLDEPCSQTRRTGITPVYTNELRDDIFNGRFFSSTNQVTHPNLESFI
jgi:hypothetical protein